MKNEVEGFFSEVIVGNLKRLILHPKKHTFSLFLSLRIGGRQED